MANVELPDHIYRIIHDAAEKEGLTPAEWIAATASRVGAPVPTDEEPRELSLQEVLKGLVGSFDSSKENYKNRVMNPMTEMAASNLKKQGIDVPWHQKR
jgi:hypothetical protein